MQRNGYIRLHRSMTDWEWYQDANTMRLWIHLLLTVNWKDAKFCGVSVPRGSRVCSLATLSAESGLSVRETRTALEHLKSTRNVTSTAHPKFTVISITNYDQYQTDDKVSDKGATRERQASDNKLKREKGKKTGNGSSSSAHARAYTRGEIKQDLISLAQDNWNRDPSPYEIRTITDLLHQITGTAEYTEDVEKLLTSVMEASATAHKPIPYIRGIIRRWTDAGIHSYADYQTYLTQLDRRDKKSASPTRGQKPDNPDKTYDLEDFFEAAVERTKRNAVERQKR